MFYHSRMAKKPWCMHTLEHYLVFISVVVTNDQDNRQVRGPKGLFQLIAADHSTSVKEAKARREACLFFHTALPATMFFHIAPRYGRN